MYRSQMIIRRLLVFVFLTAVFFMAVVPISDYDTGYHVKTGEYTLSNIKIPTHDIFSFSASGNQWINHYWLSDVLLYLAYAIAGNWGLIILVALISSLTAWIVLKTSQLSSQLSYLSFTALSVFWLFTTKVWAMWVARPQIFGYFLAAIAIYCLEKWRINRSSKSIYFIPILFLLWGDMHASVVLGVALLFLYFGVFFARNFKDILNYKKELLVFLSGIVATLLNPNGYLVLVYSAYVYPAVSKLGIFEWQSITTYLGTWKAQLELGFLSIVTLFSLWRFVNRLISKHKLEWEWIGIMLAASALPFISVRHMGFFPVLTFPIWFSQLYELIEEKHSVVNVWKHGSIATISGILIVIGFLIAQVPFTHPLDADVLPEWATQFIKNNNLQGPIFNTLGLGGYLIWKLWPQYKVFFDGRSEVYSGKVLDDYEKIINMQGDWEKIFNDIYNFNTAIVTGRVPAVDGKVERTDLVIAQQLARNLGFTLVYWDDAALVLVRNSSQNREVIDKFGYKLVGPYIDPKSISEKDADSASQEIARAVRVSPDSQVIRQYAQDFLETH